MSTLPTRAEVKRFVAETLDGADSHGIEVDTTFHDGEHGDITFFGTTTDGTDFEVVMTVQSINVAEPRE